MLRIGSVAALAVALGGCGGTLGSALVTPAGSTSDYFVACLKQNGFIPGKQDLSLALIQSNLTSGLLAPRDKPTDSTADFSAAAEAARVRDRMSKPGMVNKYLDCYIAPVDQADIEGRLLRGHIVLTLLAQFGSASLAAKERATKPDDAIAMQGHIRRAQFHLLSASPSGLRGIYGLSDPKLLPNSSAATASLAQLTKEDLPNFHTARRVSAVFEVGLDIARVDGRYIASLAGSVFDIVSGAVSSGGLNPAVFSKLRDLMGGVAEGMKLAAQNQWYGSALIADAELSILVNQTPPTIPPGDPYYRDVSRAWAYWQRRLNVACDGLSMLAGEKKTTCLPAAGDMADFIEEEFGPDHPFLKPLRDKAKDVAAKKADAIK